MTNIPQVIRGLDIIPLGTNGDASLILNYASKFSALPQPVVFNVPNLILWSITCSNKQRAALSSSQFGGNEGTQQMMIAQMTQINMDLTPYTSQMRYRFPAHLHEALARAQSE
ncbi:hypothetical protein G7Y89_g13479 [Cudoniella acicularis]|uniref:Nuclear pore protein n=1 Tax=Cudoniella acicularis TaxID=354080 RepID=A0A8H4R768_9HELO|nr:hypothetical protein G7Y89_g13479 [Cudoniella acicularis]